ncbi:MAG TPA: glycoside-pentoside-hexuronide (GPH):cation symporter [Verrucomicrobiae bacterium]|nr:glycoside-pentoside-hexuronide (GPH):cation symporter [Verrucomicrobiae bacterium]
MSEMARARTGYGVGAFGTDLLWQSTSFFLLYYYTDVLGLSSAAAGLVFGVAMIVDGLIDPLIGVLTNRTRSPLGRYRFYILVGAAPLALCYILMFAQPLTSMASSIVFAFIAQVLFRAAYAFVSIPYGSLSATLTSDSGERTSLATVKVLGAATAALFVALGTQPFVARFADPVMGWLALSVIWGVLSTSAFLVMFKLTRERAALAEEKSPPLRQLLSATLFNRPFLIVLVAIMLTSIAQTVTSKVTIYFFQYYVNRPDLAGVSLAIQVCAVIVLTPVWAWVARKSSKRAAWLAGSSIALVGQALFAVYRGVDPTVLLSLQTIMALGASAIPIMFWSLVPDVVEIGEWKIGVRAEGAIFGLVTLGQKVALGVGIGATGLLLDVIGYHAHTAQAPATLQGIHALMTLPALIGTAGAACAMAFYRLDAKTHQRLVRALAWRASRKRVA